MDEKEQQLTSFYLVVLNEASKRQWTLSELKGNLSTLCNNIDGLVKCPSFQSADGMLACLE